MAKKHFGRQLAKAMGIDYDAFFKEVTQSILDEIDERIHIDLSKFSKNAVYIKNAFKFHMVDGEIHFLNKPSA